MVCVLEILTVDFENAFASEFTEVIVLGICVFVVIVVVTDIVVCGGCICAVVILVAAVDIKEDVVTTLFVLTTAGLLEQNDFVRVDLGIEGALVGFKL